MHGVIFAKDGRRNGTRGRRQEIVMPTLHPGIFQKMFAGVLLRQDGGPGLVNPIISASVIEVPVTVDQLLDGVRIDARQRFSNLDSCGDNFSINEQLSIGPGEHRDISTGAQKNGDVAAELLHLDLRRGGFPECIYNKSIRLREQFSGSNTRCRNRQTACSEKTPARDFC